MSVNIQLNHAVAWPELVLLSSCFTYQSLLMAVCLFVQSCSVTDMPCLRLPVLFLLFCCFFFFFCLVTPNLLWPDCYPCLCSVKPCVCLACTVTCKPYTMVVVFQCHLNQERLGNTAKKIFITADDTWWWVLPESLQGRFMIEGRLPWAAARRIPLWCLDTQDRQMTQWRWWSWWICKDWAVMGEVEGARKKAALMN